MNNDDKFYGVIIVILTAITLVTVGFNEKEISTLKAKAIEVGAAEWLVDPASGDTTFAWKEKK